MSDGNKGMLVIADNVLYLVPEWKYNRSHVSTYPEVLAKLFANGYTRITPQWTINGYLNYCFSIDNYMRHDVACISWRCLIEEVNKLKL